MAPKMAGQGKQPQLKRVPVDAVRLGMHLHALDGPWLQHPFWRSRFTLTEPADVDALRSSSIRYCWIDTDKGADISQDPAPAVPQPAGGPAMPAASAPQAGDAVGDSQAPAAAPMADEMQRAALLMERSRGAVQALFREARLGRAIDTEGFLPLVDDIAASVCRNPSALISLARLKTRDDYSYLHSVAVCALMVAVAREIGHSDAACREAGMAGLLHDVGKSALPEEILNKPGALTDAERRIVRLHPERGHAMLLQARGAGPAALDVCLHHHERIDGTGYPHKLAGPDIAPLARMGAVCDVYDAVTSHRPYKAAWDPAQAIAQMASWRGHFDPDMLRAFIKVVGIYPVGSLVRLESQRLAVVVEHDARALCSPTVRVFFSIRSNMPIPTQLLELARPGVTDRIVGRESAADWGLPKLDALWGADAVHK